MVNMILFFWNLHDLKYMLYICICVYHVGYISKGVETVFGELSEQPICI